MNLRQLGPDEPSTGVHHITAVDDSGNVVARYQCPCQWCEMWPAAERILKEGMAAIERAALGDPR